MLRALDSSLRCKSGVALRSAPVSGLLRNPQPPIMRSQTPSPAVAGDSGLRSAHTGKVLIPNLPGAKGSRPRLPRLEPDWRVTDPGAWGQGGIQASGGIQIGGTLRVRQGPENAPVWGYPRGVRRTPKMGLFWGVLEGSKIPPFWALRDPLPGGPPGGAPGGPRGADFGPRGARGPIFGPPKTTLSCF